MTATRWIIGRGLLGRAVLRAGAGDALTASVRWRDDALAKQDLRTGVSALADVDGPLEVYWCAGRGVTSTSAAVLAAEVGVFEAFLASLRELPAAVRGRLSVFLASSVGGAYAGSKHPPFTEHTPAAPLTPYGTAKLRMEELLRVATREGGWRSFISRITNLYGPGQDLSKAQGLISVLVAGHVTGSPVSVYVSLDTLRDYVYEDDAAAVIVAGTARVADEAPGSTVVKVVGTMRTVSIGAILSELTRLNRRRGPIVLGQGPSRGQALDLRVRSEVWTDLDALVRTTLPEGLGRVFAAQLRSTALPDERAPSSAS
jgi:UDP-glucose 4-epimerase